jgi:hypothetical protein
MCPFDSLHCYQNDQRLLFFLICIVGGGVQSGSIRHVGHLLAYYTCPGWLWGWRIWWNEWHGKPKYWEKTCPDATLSTTNPTWPDPGLNPGRRDWKPPTNRFSYGAATRDYLVEKFEKYMNSENSRRVLSVKRLVVSLPAQWLCMVLDLLHSFETVNFSRVGYLA